MAATLSGTRILPCQECGLITKHRNGKCEVCGTGVTNK